MLFSINGPAHQGLAKISQTDGVLFVSLQTELVQSNALPTISVLCMEHEGIMRLSVRYLNISYWTIYCVVSWDIFTSLAVFWRAGRSSKITRHE